MLDPVGVGPGRDERMIRTRLRGHLVGGGDAAGAGDQLQADLNHHPYGRQPLSQASRPTHPLR
jgi:hypothetical protein